MLRSATFPAIFAQPKFFDPTGFAVSMSKMIVESYQFIDDPDEFDTRKYQEAKRHLELFKQGKIPKVEPIYLPDNPDENARYSIRQMADAVEQEKKARRKFEF